MIGDGSTATILKEFLGYVLQREPFSQNLGKYLSTEYFENG